jgi:hypothetical protein
MNAEQHGALERGRTRVRSFRTFMHAENTGVPPLIWYDTYRQFTGD